jgi:transposase
MQESITYVGMDVHTDTIAIAVLSPRARKPDLRIIDNTPKTVRRTFKKLKKDARLKCCYEAGPCGFETYRQLTDMEIPCDVIAPSLIPRRPGDRVKTDRRDATKLARLYRAGELTAINIPTEEQEADRDLVRAREQIRKDLTVARHRLAKFLTRHGHVYRAGRRWSDRFWKWLRGLHFEHESARSAFEHYQIQVQHLMERKAELNLQIEELASTEPYRDAVQRLTCLRGIATLSAMVLLTEIRDFRRFGHPRQLMSFVGLVPCERSSGQKHRRGQITKAGNSHVRRILVEAAWHHRNPASIGPRVLKLLPGQPPEAVSIVKKSQWRLVKRYRKLVGWGKQPQVAVTAVAREMCGFIWALMTLQSA